MRGEGRALGAFWLLMAAAVAFPSSVTFAQSQPKSSGKKLVCWNDELGRKSCGDSVPPRYADKQRKVVDGTGRTVKVIPGALTPEQRAAAEAQARQDAATQRAADQQAAYDRALLATYAKPQELAALRDDRLASLDTTIQLSESAARRETVSVAELRARLPAPGSKDKAPPGLLKQITQFETALSETQQSLSDMRKNRETLCANFTRDIQRFQELKSGAVTYSSPCPAAGSLAPDAEATTDIAGARAFFDRHAELENDFDPALLNNFADTAVIKVTQVDASGKSVMEERRIAVYRAEQLKALPVAKQKLDTHQYADVKVEPGKGGRAMVSGRRISTLSKSSAPFYFVVKTSGDKQWKIVEAWSEAQPAPAAP